MNNVETVQRIYAAFGRGDVPAILECLDPDVDWEYNASTDGPRLVRRRGRDAVAGFFGALGQGLEITGFVPKEILASPDQRVVAMLVDVVARVKANGQAIEETDEIHLWRFGPDGRVVRFRHGVDSARHAAALRAPTASGTRSP